MRCSIGSNEGLLKNFDDSSVSIYTYSLTSIQLLCRSTNSDDCWNTILPCYYCSM